MQERIQKEIPSIVDADPRWEQVWHIQEAPGHCAAAAMHLALRYSQLTQSEKGLQVDIPTETEIYEDTNVSWWGTPGDLMAIYLSRFLPKWVKVKILQWKKYINKLTKEILF